MTLKRGAKVSGVSDLDLDKDIQTAGCRTDPNRAKCGHQTPITGEKWAKQDIKATHPLPERTPPRNKVSGTCKCWPRSSWIPFGVILGRFFFAPLGPWKVRVRLIFPNQARRVKGPNLAAAKMTWAKVMKKPSPPPPLA